MSELWIPIEWLIRSLKLSNQSHQLQTSLHVRLSGAEDEIFPAKPTSDSSISFG